MASKCRPMYPLGSGLNQGQGLKVNSPENASIGPKCLLVPVFQLCSVFGRVAIAPRKSPVLPFGYDYVVCDCDAHNSQYSRSVTPGLIIVIMIIYFNNVNFPAVGVCSGAGDFRAVSVGQESGNLRRGGHVWTADRHDTQRISYANSSQQRP